VKSIKYNNPSDFHPHLLSERLLTVAEVVAHAKNELFSSAEPENGDGGWGIGCHGADRGRIRLRTLAEKTVWLTYQQEGSLAYWIKIGDVPIRVSRIDIEPSAASERQRAASTQLDLPGFSTTQPPELRLQIDQTNNQNLRDRRVVRVYLTVLEGDNEVASWQVWPQAEAGVMVPPSPIPLRAAPVSLPEADFKINDDKDDAGTGD